MAANGKQNFYWRAFVTFYIILSFIIMSASGIVLYFSPPGRVAFWSEWRFFALTKEQWQAVHTIFTFLFVAAAAFHIYFNWKVIVSYLKTKLREGMKRKKELIFSSSFVLLILIFTIASFPPFSNVMDFGSALSNSWADEKNEPPIPHAELLSVTEFAEVVKVPADKIQERLAKQNIKIDDFSETIKSIASRYKTTPQKLYEMIKVNVSAGGFKLVEGGGYGRKSLEEISGTLNISVDEAIATLKSNGITAEKDNNIRELALKNNLSPIEIVKIISPSSLKE